jgi:hypothetical protein
MLGTLQQYRIHARTPQYRTLAAISVADEGVQDARDPQPNASEVLISGSDDRRPCPAQRRRSTFLKLSKHLASPQNKNPGGLPPGFYESVSSDDVSYQVR